MGGSLGKLKAAARWLFTDPRNAASSDEEREQALAKLGVPADQIRAVHRAQPTETEAPLQLWRWHQDALDLLQGMRSQWIAVGTFVGVARVGLNLAALPVVAQWLGLEPSRTLFKQLEVMAREARDMLNQAELE